MKIIIRAFNLSLCLVLIVLILSSLIQKNLVQSELRSVVSEALLQSTRPVLDKRYDIETEDDYIAEFEQHLLTNIRYSKGMQLDIYYFGADVSHGILSVIVDLKVPFLFFTNRKIHVNTQQSILLEDKQEEILWYDIRYHNVTLDQLDPNTPLVHIYGQETQLINPTKEDAVFKEFQDANGNSVTKIEATTNQAIDLYAIWE